MAACKFPLYSIKISPSWIKDRPPDAVINSAEAGNQRDAERPRRFCFANIEEQIVFNTIMRQNQEISIKYRLLQ